jgi:diguanylate cyclase (GGDEF)-like protein/PAS domain S-box-containing protein
MYREWPPAARQGDADPPTMTWPFGDAPHTALAALTELCADAVIGSQVNGTITSWNHGAQGLFGYTAREAIGRNVSRLVSPVGETKIIDRLRSGQRVERLQTQGLHKDGSLVDIALSCSLVRNGAGEPAGVLMVGHDFSERARLEGALREREAGLRRAQTVAQLAHVITRGDGSFESWFETLPQLIGRPASQLPRTTREWLGIVHPDDRATFRAKSIEAALSGHRTELQYRLQRGDGRWAWMHQEIEPLDGTLDADGKRRWFNTLQDITDHKQSEDRIRRLNRLYAVLSGINTLIVRVRERGELFRDVCRIAVELGAFQLAWIELSDAHAEQGRVMASLSSHDLSIADVAAAARPTATCAARDARPAICNDVSHEMATGASRDALLAHGVRSLGCFPIKTAGGAKAVLMLGDDEVGRFDDDEQRLLFELAGDIAFALDHIDKQERLDYLAYYDALTGLANSTLFAERLARFIETAEQSQRGLALLVLDIERFKTVNDTLGRHAGDLVLQELARRLARNPVGASTVARIGADRFAVIVPDVNHDTDIARILEERLHGWLDEPIVLPATELGISVRVGVALYPNDGSAAEPLFANAEAALKRAKSTGERYVFYADEMTSRVAGQLALEGKLRQALAKNEFVLHYQPKVGVDGRRMASVEALLRWEHPEHGLVPPATFIPLLEQSGMIVEVGAWALRRAVEDQQFWRDQQLPVPRVAVNVSALQLRQPAFVDTVQRAIEGASSALDIEITESLAMQDIEATIPKLAALRELGIGTAIDDFGTGHSSLAYLARLPVQALKIDRSFVGAMADDADVMTVVSTIVSLAHAMRLKVVAEGVETEEQASILHRLGCDEMQGYLVSQPLPREELAQLLRQDAASRGGRNDVSLYATASS